MLTEISKGRDLYSFRIRESEQHCARNAFRQWQITSDDFMFICNREKRTNRGFKEMAVSSVSLNETVQILYSEFTLVLLAELIGD